MNVRKRIVIVVSMFFVVAASVMLYQHLSPAKPTGSHYAILQNGFMLQSEELHFDVSDSDTKIRMVAALDGHFSLQSLSEVEREVTLKIGKNAPSRIKLKMNAGPVPIHVKKGMDFEIACAEGDIWEHSVPSPY